VTAEQRHQVTPSGPPEKQVTPTPPEEESWLDVESEDSNAVQEVAPPPQKKRKITKQPSNFTEFSRQHQHHHQAPEANQEWVPPQKRGQQQQMQQQMGQHQQQMAGWSRQQSHQGMGQMGYGSRYQQQQQAVEMPHRGGVRGGHPGQAWNPRGYGNQWPEGTYGQPIHHSGGGGAQGFQHHHSNGGGVPGFQHNPTAGLGALIPIAGPQQQLHIPPMQQSGGFMRNDHLYTQTRHGDGHIAGSERAFEAFDTVLGMVRSFSPAKAEFGRVIQALQAQASPPLLRLDEGLDTHANRLIHILAQVLTLRALGGDFEARQQEAFHLLLMVVIMRAAQQKLTVADASTWVSSFLKNPEMFIHKYSGMVTQTHFESLIRPSANGHQQRHQSERRQAAFPKGCINWNNGACPEGVNCPFKHICRRCGSPDHTDRNCGKDRRNP